MQTVSWPEPPIGNARTWEHLEVAKCDLKIYMAKKQTSVPATLPLLPQLRIYELRGERVVLDHDVARIFGVDTKRLNEQVTRNAEKFGNDFAFRLTADEFAILRSQNATSSDAWGGNRYPPRVFTEHGVVMAATVLRSLPAIQATRLIVKSFVEARHASLVDEQIAAGAARNQLALPLAFRNELMNKINQTLGHVLDAMIDSKNQITVRDEAKAIAAEGLKAVKEFLKKSGIENEKSLAEIRRVMAEAEAIEVDTEGKRTENHHRQLALLAKQLRLVLQAQHYVETGSLDGLMQVLSDLEKA